jgi:hypothetical protein
MYMNEKWNYKVRDDLNCCTDDLEMLWLEIDKDSTNSKSNIIAGLIYRRQIPLSLTKSYRIF